MKETLAVKYRPSDWDSVIEQDSVKTILQNQIDNNDIKNAYLFVGASGCGKTTCARIFANEINAGTGTPIEIDGASYNGVDAVRNISDMAQTKSIDSEYKIIIIDECHMITIQGWNAFLKLIEEPPAKTIFIFCTTNPEKIPMTILSRVQRYDFQRISQQGIVDRLEYILEYENRDALEWDWENNAIEYIARLANGGMRSAIALLDKCLSYSNELTLDNVISALGISDYEYITKLFNSVMEKDEKTMLEILADISNSGMDLKAVIKQFFEFSFDVHTYIITKDVGLTQLHNISDIVVNSDVLKRLLPKLVELIQLIKYDDNPKIMIGYTLWEVIQE